MTKTKSTKRSMLVSALALLLCVSMLVGSTFAWFTDSVESVNNKIVAGNLDVELKYYKNNTWTEVDASTNLFDTELWEPGHTEVIYLQITNAGELALQYRLGINIVSETQGVNVAGDNFKLSDYIFFGVEDGKQPSFATRTEAVKAVEDTAAVISTGYSTAGKMLDKGDTRYLALVVYMPETVGNEANYRGQTAPVINMGVNLVATQQMHENDSFGNDYDADALVCDILATPETIDAILADAKEGTVIGLTAGKYGTLVMPRNNLTLLSNTAVVDCVDVHGRAGIVLDGLTFDPDGAQELTNAAPGKFANIMDNSLQNGTGALPGAADLVIKNCRFVDADGISTAADETYISIYFNEQGRAGTRAHNVTITNCSFECNALNYISMYYPSNGDIYVTNNTFGGGTYGTSHHNVNATGNGSSWTIAGNTFSNWADGEYAFGSSRQGSQKLVMSVRNNTFNKLLNAGAQIPVLSFKSSYTAANSTILVSDNAANYGYAQIDAEIQEDGKFYMNTDVEVTATADTTAVKEALKNGGTVVLTDSLEVPANESNAYGKTGLNMKDGGVFDGNGKTLSVPGANSTWDSAVNITSGTIKNLTINAGFRGVFINHNGSTNGHVTLENVVVDGPVYTISCDQGTNNGLTAINSTFNGWTSYAATVGNVEFIDCSFGEGAGYNFSRPYAPTTYVGCDFAAGHEIAPRAAVTFENCTIGGEPLTAENLATLVTSNIANATVIG